MMSKELVSPIIDDMADSMASMLAVDQLSVLEAMHQRVIEIGNERIEEQPIPKGAPEPGILGGRYATLRRTSKRETVFYITDSNGEPSKIGMLVPIIPKSEFELLTAINGLGLAIHSSMDSEGRKKAHLSRLRRR